VWGKIIGGMAGFAMGGPAGAVFGAALGHAMDNGGLGQFPPGASPWGMFGPAAMPYAPSPAARRDHVFTVGVVVLAAKLAKCDGPVVRVEIDSFKRHFRIPPEAQRDIGRLFDHARDSADRPEEYAAQLGEVFADNRLMLEDVLAALFAIARADGPLNRREEGFLGMAAHGFGLGPDAWARARDGGPRHARSETDGIDPYSVLGIARSASDEELRTTWRQLMRENHPDSLASRGVPAEFIARAGEKVARINAAWDRIKRERGL
jgi:DnaJ like chaperone protein